MSTSHIVRRGAIACAILGAVPAVASAQAVNGLKVNPRVFNDIPGSTAVIANSNSNPGNVTVTETAFPAGSTGVNRHDILLSSDNGATARTFSPNVGFTISTNINLAPTANSPRKEAGIRLNDPVTGDTLFIINSDAGEIVAFGGGASFFLFGNNGGGNGYTPGTTINMGLTYRPGVPSTTNGTPATIEYFIDRDINSAAGFSTSGPLAYSNLEGGPVSFNVGVYTQGGGNAPTAVNTTTFTNLTATIVPEPATLGTLAVAGLATLRRRRA